MVAVCENHDQQMNNHLISALPRLIKLLIITGNAPWHKSQICHCWSVRENMFGLLYMMMNKSTAEFPHSNASSTYLNLQTTVASWGRQFLQAKVTFGRLNFAKPFFAKAVTIKTFRLTQETWDVSSIISQISLRMCSCFALQSRPLPDYK